MTSDSLFGSNLPDRLVSVSDTGSGGGIGAFDADVRESVTSPTALQPARDNLGDTSLDAAPLDSEEAGHPSSVSNNHSSASFGGVSFAEAALQSGRTLGGGGERDEGGSVFGGEASLLSSTSLSGEPTFVARGRESRPSEAGADDAAQHSEVATGTRLTYSQDVLQALPPDQQQAVRDEAAGLVEAITFRRRDHGGHTRYDLHALSGEFFAVLRRDPNQANALFEAIIDALPESQRDRFIEEVGRDLVLEGSAFSALSVGLDDKAKQVSVPIHHAREAAETIIERATLTVPLIGSRLDINEVAHQVSDLATRDPALALATVHTLVNSDRLDPPQAQKLLQVLGDGGHVLDDLASAFRHPGDAAKGASKAFFNSFIGLGELLANSFVRQSGVGAVQGAALLEAAGQSGQAADARATGESVFVDGAADVTLPTFQLNGSAEEGGAAAYNIVQAALAARAIYKGAVFASRGLRHVFQTIVTKGDDIAINFKPGQDLAGELTEELTRRGGNGGGLRPGVGGEPARPDDEGLALARQFRRHVNGGPGSTGTGGAKGTGGTGATGATGGNGGLAVATRPTQTVTATQPAPAPHATPPQTPNPETGAQALDAAATLIVPGAFTGPLEIDPANFGAPAANPLTIPAPRPEQGSETQTRTAHEPEAETAAGTSGTGSGIGAGTTNGANGSGGRGLPFQTTFSGDGPTFTPGQPSPSNHDGETGAATGNTARSTDRPPSQPQADSRTNQPGAPVQYPVLHDITASPRNDPTILRPGDGDVLVSPGDDRDQRLPGTEQDITISPGDFLDDGAVSDEPTEPAQRPEKPLLGPGQRPATNQPAPPSPLEVGKPPEANPTLSPASQPFGPGAHPERGARVPNPTDYERALKDAQQDTTRLDSARFGPTVHFRQEPNPAQSLKYEAQIPSFVTGETVQLNQTPDPTKNPSEFDIRSQTGPQATAHGPNRPEDEDEDDTPPIGQPLPQNEADGLDNRGEQARANIATAGAELVVDVLYLQSLLNNLPSDGAQINQKEIDTIAQEYRNLADGVSQLLADGKALADDGSSSDDSGDRLTLDTGPLEVLAEKLNDQVRNVQAIQNRLRRTFMGAEDIQTRLNEAIRGAENAEQVLGLFTTTSPSAAGPAETGFERGLRQNYEKHIPAIATEFATLQSEISTISRSIGDKNWVAIADSMGKIRQLHHRSEILKENIQQSLRDPLDGMDTHGPDAGRASEKFRPMVQAIETEAGNISAQLKSVIDGFSRPYKFNSQISGHLQTARSHLGNADNELIKLKNGDLLPADFADRFPELTNKRLLRLLTNIDRAVGILPGNKNVTLSF
ncbi:MAG: hypothetical protein AAGK25_09010, partial [Pseudomonadota bacterium]